MRRKKRFFSYYESFTYNYTHVSWLTLVNGWSPHSPLFIHFFFFFLRIETRSPPSHQSISGRSTRSLSSNLIGIQSFYDVFFFFPSAAVAAAARFHKKKNARRFSLFRHTRLYSWTYLLIVYWPPFSEIGHSLALNFCCFFFRCSLRRSIQVHWWSSF